VLRGRAGQILNGSGLTGPRAVGVFGSALVAVGGLGAGALPARIEILVAGRRHPDLGLVGVYAGLALMLLGWWWYGRAARGRTGPDEHPSGREAFVTLAWWVAPLLLAPPMFSRDVYSYLAQGQMLDAGLDVYRHGPAVLGGLVAGEVPAIWQQTPSPYGPVFLLVAVAVTAVAQSHLLLGVLAMRLVAVVGLVLLAAAVPVLARSGGVRPVAALWLTVLNPLVLIHLIGGAHNDALMVGLLAVGLAAAVRHRPVVATLLVVAAALVKVPAAVALAAVAGLWAAQMPGRWRVPRALGGTTAIAVVATAAVTALAGTGYGWVGALRTPISPYNWSVTGLLGRWAAALLTDDRTGAALMVAGWRWAGVLATLVVAGLVWTYRERFGPIYGLGVVLIAVVVFGPALRPWYLVWGLVPLATSAVHPRVRRLLALSCAALVLLVLPSGFAARWDQVALAVLGVAIGSALFAVVRLLATPPGTLRPAWAGGPGGGGPDLGGPDLGGPDLADADLVGPATGRGPR
jgi:alpha-1,6-mannosyltransferase